MYSRGQKLRMTQILHFQSLLPQLVWWQFAYTPECYEEWSDELQSTFLPCEWTESPKKPADMSVILSLTQVSVLMRTRVRIILSCWLSSNNRLEASKGRWCLESLFFFCHPIVTCKETRAVIIALHKKGFTGKDIAASKIPPKSTIYRIIKNFKESGSIVVKKASGRPASARTVS